MPKVTFRDILTRLNGTQYETDKEVNEAVRQEFNKNVLDFPRGYNQFDVIKQGLDNGWIETTPQGRLTIDTAKGHQEATAR